MSALPLEADSPSRLGGVGFVPISDNRLRYATPLAHLGGGAGYELTSTPDHSLQAVQGKRCVGATLSAGE
jgi:hypothetical protein